MLYTPLVICPQNISIPTMDTGAEVAKRFYKELTDIQVSIYASRLSIEKVLISSFCLFND
jgi:hypothetical protein